MSEAVSVQLLVAPWDLDRVRGALAAAELQLLEVPAPSALTVIYMVAPAAGASSKIAEARKALDPLRGDPPMHTTRTAHYTWHHNGDFSGEVKLTVTPDAIEHLDASSAFVTIDFEDIKELVADSIRNARIAALEQADADEILGGY